MVNIVDLFVAAFGPEIVLGLLLGLVVVIVRLVTS
ncbi:hypothetical protein SAMN06265347_1316 [Halobellus salinus]|nr:hypothetical protein SAMN06265347_1316 [Halobellus salinus]